MPTIAASKRSKEPVTVQYGEYTAVIVPGESITIRCKKVVDHVPTGNYRLYYYGGKDGDAGRAWIGTLTQSQKNDLAPMLRVGDCLLSGIAGDWIEEHGGRREWFFSVSATMLTEPVYKDMEATYGIGDQAEHSSFNLSYMGRILSITGKTVTIEDWHRGHGKTKRLDIETFCWRNWEGSAVKMSRNRDFRD